MTRSWAFALRPLKLTRGIDMYILDSSLLESDLKFSKSHVNAVSFDENVSHLSNLFERNEHFLLETKKTSAQLTWSRETKKTYVTIQDNKHRLTVLRTDSSFKTSRNGDEEVSKRSRSKWKFICKYTYRDKEPSRLRCNKKMFKISRLKCT